ncbi:hypothetical protein HDE_07577 [Halotydeus destructor]|nr:hypothetical protein HDE_07577 [Halotydeus destructor]
MKATAILLLLVMVASTVGKDDEELKSMNDFTSLDDYAEFYLPLAKDVHIPFEVDDKLFKGEKFKCYVDKANYENGKYNRKKYRNFTVVQKDCHKQHEAKMKQADYGDYNYCIVDNYNRLAGHRGRMMLTADNKTLYSEALPGIPALVAEVLEHYYSKVCIKFCQSQVTKYTQVVDKPGTQDGTIVITGPAINILRQVRRCLGLTKLGDKYKWPAPK